MDNEQVTHCQMCLEAFSYPVCPRREAVLSAGCDVTTAGPALSCCSWAEQPHHSCGSTTLSSCWVSQGLQHPKLIWSRLAEKLHNLKGVMCCSWPIKKPEFFSLQTWLGQEKGEAVITIWCSFSPHCGGLWVSGRVTAVVTWEVNNWYRAGVSSLTQASDRWCTKQVPAAGERVICKICRVCRLRVNNVSLPWGNEIWQDGKRCVIMSLVLSGVLCLFNRFYFSVTQLQPDFLTEQALWLLFRMMTCQAISSPALLMSLPCICQLSKALLLGAQPSGVQLYFVSRF